MGNSYSHDPEDCFTDVSQVHQKMPLTWCRREWYQIWYHSKFDYHKAEVHHPPESPT